MACKVLERLKCIREDVRDMKRILCSSIIAVAIALSAMGGGTAYRACGDGGIRMYKLPSASQSLHR
jgi:hypothetical protein